MGQEIKQRESLKYAGALKIFSVVEKPEPYLRTVGAVPDFIWGMG